MSSIVKDLVENSTLIEDASGVQAVRQFLVDGVSGSAEGKVWAARNASGVPRYGNSHPVIPNIKVTRISVSTISPSQMRVEVYYGSQTDTDILESGGIVVSYDTTVIQKSVTEDINGHRLTFDYEYRLWGTLLSQYGSSLHKTAEIDVPLTTMDIVKLESAAPNRTADSLVSRVNSQAWAGRAAKTWLCVGVNSQPHKNRHRVTYRFTNNPDTWMIRGRDQGSMASYDEDGEKIDISRWIGDYDVYRSVNFAGYGLNP